MNSRVHGARFRNLAALAALAVLATQHAHATITLAARGQPARSCIVVRHEASECERHAAEELQTFLKRQTGVDVPIADDSAALPPQAVLLGWTSHSHKLLESAGAWPFDVGSLGDEGFRLKSCGTHLLVLAGRGRGALYGVYELLEHFGGCAWYSTRIEKVPEIESFNVPDDLDVAQRPAFELRTQNGNGMYGHRELAARLRLNLENFGPELGGSAFRFDQRLGKCHTFDALLPPERWFKTHPEYFAEVGGRRLGFRTQPCLTNPDVLRICTEEVLRRIAESYPKGIRLYGVSQNDWTTWCSCVACSAIDRREKSHSGTLIRFVNAIAEAVECRYPDVVIQTLAYLQTRRPPATIIPRHNVQICLCTIECDFAQPIPVGRSIENRQTRHAFGVWGSYPSTLGVWDYTTDFACYLHPWPNFRSMRGNMRFFLKSGARQVLEQNDGAGENDIWTDIRIWLLSRWMWNPELEEDALLDRCLADCFGPAARHMRRYLDVLHGFPRDTRRLPMGCFERVHAPGLPGSVLDTAAGILADAADRACGTPYAGNVLRARLPVDFTRAMRGYARPFLSRDISRLDATRYAEEQAGARRVASVLHSPGGLRFAGDRVWNESLRRRIEEFAVRPAPVKPLRRLALEEWNLVGRIPTAFETVDDPLAGNGRAVRLPGRMDACTAWFWMDDVLADPDVRYTVRLRVRFSDVPPGTEAFCAGIYNRTHERAVNGISVKASGTSSGSRYVWYSLKPFSPRVGDAVWIGLGGGMERPDVWIDRIEIVRLD